MWWTKKREPECLCCLAHLAAALLTETHDAPMSQYWRRERVTARRIIRRAQRPGYPRTPQARADLNWLRLVLDEVREFAIEASNQPEDYTPGWGTTYSWPEGSELVGTVG